MVRSDIIYYLHYLEQQTQTLVVVVVAVAVQGGPKNVPNCFLSELSQISIKVANFSHTDGQDNRIVRYTHFPSHLIYVNALPWKMQMLQIAPHRQYS